MRILIIVLFFTISLSVHSQSIFFDPSDRKSEILDILSIAEDEYVIASREFGNSTDKVQWFKDGNLFKEQVIINDLSHVDLKLSEEGILVEAYSFLECDIVFPLYSYYLLDTAQSPYYIDFDSSFQENFANVKRLDNETLIFLSGDAIAPQSEILTIYKADNIVFSASLPNKRITEIAEVNDKVFVYGLEYAFEIDTATFQIDTFLYQDESILKIVKTDNENEIALLHTFGVDIINLDSDSIISTYPIYSGDGSPLDIIYTDRLYLLRSTEEYKSVLMTLDEDDQWTTDFQPFYAAEFRQLYRTFNDKIWLAGRYNNYPENNIQQYDGQYIVQEVRNLIDEDNDLAVEIVSHQDDGNRNIEMSVNLTNNSSEVQRNISVYSTNVGYFWCSESYFEKFVDSISPGEEILLIDTITLYTNTSFEGEVCVYTLGSGSNLDLAIEDNFSCELITSVNEQKAPRETLTLQPNPVIDVLILPSQMVNKEYFIFNSSGRLIRRSMVTSTMIDVSNLSSGIYFYKIVVDDQSVTARFVKQ